MATTTVMAPGGQQGQQQPTQLVVVQQPVVVPGMRKASPFLLRGARFSNGCNMPGRAIIFMITFGGILTFLGVSSGVTTGLTVIWIPFLFIGGGLLGCGIWLCVTARRQFNELPPDHIHRLKYGSGYTIPVTNINNATTYTFPTAGGTAGYPGVTPGQAPSYPVQASSYSVQAGQTTYPYPAAGQSGYPVGAQGVLSAPSGGQDPYNPASAPPLHPSVNDNPPPYSEIMKDSYK